MKRAIFAREITVEEKQAIAKALSSRDAFNMRRAQILRLSGEQKKIPPEIADSLDCAVQTVRTVPRRDVIRAFNRSGISGMPPSCLQRQAMGPKNPKRTVNASKRDLKVYRNLCQNGSIRRNP